jgi:hypothetical protein
MRTPRRTLYLLTWQWIENKREYDSDKAHDELQVVVAELLHLSHRLRVSQILRDRSGLDVRHVGFEQRSFLLVELMVRGQLSTRRTFQKKSLNAMRTRSDTRLTQKREVCLLSL